MSGDLLETAREGMSIPETARTAIDQLLDECARIQAGQEVLLLAYEDGLRGGDNLVDETAISWLEAGVRARGANPTVLWADERSAPHEWRFPPIVRGAFAAADVMINNTLDLSQEETAEFKYFVWDKKKLMVRNFATTSSLLCTRWARTPHRLVSEIRYQMGLLIKAGANFVLTDPNGTHLVGKVLPACTPEHPWFSTYAVRREEVGFYRPWPEWVVPPIRIAETSGEFVFDRMLSWWSRYMGISPYFDSPVRIEIKDNRIRAIEGGREASVLRSFLEDLEGRMGADMHTANAFHSGVHPYASVTPEECPNILYRRIIEHSHTSNIHLHIGAAEPTSSYPYWPHITGDIRCPTLRLDDVVIHENGHLSVLDLPQIKHELLKEE